MTETSGDPFSSAGNSAGGPESPAPQPQSGLTAAQLDATMPKFWIGYVLAFASLLGEAIAFSRHPELFKSNDFVVPPLEMFLPVFVTRVYWFVCVYRIHKVLTLVPGYVHPVSPAKAVGFHFIPVFQMYWVFHWPIATARFVNDRLRVSMRGPLMRGWVFGLGIFLAFLWSLIEPASGSMLLFSVTAYLAAVLNRVLLLDSMRPGSQA